MLKVRLNCPLCGELIGASSLDGHLEKVHKLTGTVTLRLNPTHPFVHEPEPEQPAEHGPEEPVGPEEPEQKE